MIENIKFNELENLALSAFNSVLNDSFSEIKSIGDTLYQLESSRPGVGEIFRQDFSFFWNKLQVNHYFKKGEFVDFPQFVQKMPSIWIESLNQKTKKQIKKLDLNLDGIRVFDIDKFLTVTKKFNQILSFVYEINEFEGITFLKNSNLNQHYGEIKNIEQIQNSFLKLIYLSSGLSIFKNVVKDKDKEDYIVDLIGLYFDKDLKKNSIYFTQYVDYKIKKDKLKLEELYNKRVEHFLPTQNDLKFLTYLKSEVGESLVNKAITEIAGINNENENLGQRIVTQFNYHLLNSECEIKSESQIIKRVIKV